MARVTVRNAGTFNGFLKPQVRLFAAPLTFDAGALVLSPEACAPGSAAGAQE